MYNKVRKKVALKVLVTGGTFDKEYDGLEVYEDVEEARVLKTPIAPTQQEI